MADDNAGRSTAVVIGCSTGGLHALSTILAALRPDLAVPVIAVCHRGQDDDGMLLVELLARHSLLPVREAEERQPATPGIVHLAPSGYHLLLEADGRFMLSTDPRVRYVRPSVDVLFQSAADVHREGLLAAVLTGAKRLILLTSAEGLLAPDSAEPIPEVTNIGDVMKFVRDDQGKFSIGGMASKLTAVKYSVENGVETWIANGRKPERLIDLVNGHGIGTRFVPQQQTV